MEKIVVNRDILVKIFKIMQHNWKCSKTKIEDLEQLESDDYPEQECDYFLEIYNKINEGE